MSTLDELDRVLNDFERRGISTAVLQEHVPGREIKFYAVRGDFFYWLDTDNPRIHGIRGEAFEPCARESGAALSLDIFGGDLVIGEDGRATLIDLNDWPSFAPCREAAARAIARHLEFRSLDAYVASSPAGNAVCVRLILRAVPGNPLDCRHDCRRDRDRGVPQESDHWNTGGQMNQPADVQADISSLQISDCRLQTSETVLSPI